jgi:hypothetical protein
MKMPDNLIGKDIKSISPYIIKDTIYSIFEINSSSEINKSTDEIKKQMFKNTSNKYLIITLKRK